MVLVLHFGLRKSLFSTMTTPGPREKGTRARARVLRPFKSDPESNRARHSRLEPRLVTSSHSSNPRLPYLSSTSWHHHS
eukprot:1542472-Rhodomonas_salina.2